MSLTSDPKDPCLVTGQKEEGQNSCYLILSEEERAKGFVRPYRESYIHRGKKVELENGGKLRELTEEEKLRYSKYKYVAFIEYSEEYRKNNSVLGRYVLQAEYDAFHKGEKYVGGCGTSTKMAMAIAETYARDPKFYGATFCCNCNKHLPVDEFVWEGTDELVGS